MASPIVPVDGLSEDPAECARFEEWARLFAVADLADLGDTDAWTAEELRVALRNPDKRYAGLAALDERDTVVGAAELIMQVRDNTHLVILNLAVHPDRRRRGIGSRLLARVEQLTREHGRRTIIVETAWLPDGNDGSGTFARRHGFSDEQTMRRSDFPVTDDLPEPGMPMGYALETHVGTPPESLAEDRALLNRRMSTDAPVGDLELEEQDWDAERIYGLDARIEQMGRRRVSAFARDLVSGRLAGFTEIQIPQTATDLAYQDDTLVLREHRGHGLGLALKRAAAAVLRDAYPSVRTVRTWNATENEHMLAVNDALGYVPSGFVREWQKRL